mmetsp:Transcript_6079/g.11198  ORF Transcript_6079/g.11198 Transcript_6079/m.11198 type:complete len:382 (+) Transcript_6079:250-1395(+)
MVCPSTVWNVLLGHKSNKYPKVVPAGKGHTKSLTIAIYSHGDSHPALRATQKGNEKKDETTSTSSSGGEQRADETKSSALSATTKSLAGPPNDKPYLDPLQHEWYVHLPYPSECKKTSGQILSFVATDGSIGAGKTRDKPECYLYATQLRAIFVKLFQYDPNRPVIALLNYCRSGGGLEFLRRPNTRKLLGADSWPLFLMSSCQASHDALVGGIWDTWFDGLAKFLTESEAKDDYTAHDKKLSDLFFEAKRDYHIHNLYELKDLVKTLAFPSNFSTTSNQNRVAARYDEDLAGVICAAPDGSPDYKKAREMQQRYEMGKSFRGDKVVFYHPNDWCGDQVNLEDAIRKAVLKSAIPECICGSESAAELTLKDLFSEEESKNE